VDAALVRQDLLIVPRIEWFLLSSVSAWRFHCEDPATLDLMVERKLFLDASCVWRWCQACTRVGQALPSASDRRTGATALMKAI
jgi:hypothetical protein